MYPPSVEAGLLEPWLRPPPTRQNPNSGEEQLQLLFHFAAPQEQELSMGHRILYQNQAIPGNPYLGVDQSDKSHVEVKAKGKLLDPKVEKKVDPPVRRRNMGVLAPRRRAGKKDRHSKICTAQGIRDRRMRLSLQAARKFFDLQDMLGYDKASKTIEWLFTKSKKAIRELTENHPPVNSNVSDSDAKSESFVSECDEVVSGIEEGSNKDAFKDVEKEEKHSEKLHSKPNLRESRDKARARARCRTKEKQMTRFTPQIPESAPTENDHHLQKLGFSTNPPFEAPPPPDQDPAYTDQARILSYGVDYEQQPPDSGTLEKLLGIPSSSSCPHHFTSDSFIDPNTSFLGFLTSWDYLSHERGGSSNCTVTDQI